jgi:pilus assembly protein CpaB
MPLRTIATFAIAIVLGLFAVILINMYMGSQRKVQVAQVQSGVGSPVVVAAVPITRGVVVQPQLLKVVNYPAGSVPVGAFTKISDLTGTKDQQRIALGNMVPDQPVLTPELTQPGQKLNLATELDPGTQAVAVRMTDVTGVGGFVLPNDRVDVMLSRSVPHPNGNPTLLTQVVAENVRVLGVDQSDDEDANKPVVVKAVTLELTPEQAQSVTLAQTMGTVSLSLRHVEDTAPVTRMATTNAAFGFVGSTNPVAHHAEVHRVMGPSVRVTRGTDTSVYELSAR